MRAMLIGFPKSGTSTIHRALQRSGFRSAHWRTPKGFCGKLIYESFLAGDDPFAQMAEFDAMTQADVCLRNGANYWPNLDFNVLNAIRRHHPECLFILNRRATEKLVSSITRWNDFRERLIAADIPGLPRGFGGDDRHLTNWIEGHYAACSESFQGSPHYLDFDIEAADARACLAAAVGVPIKWWGVANVGNNPSPEMRSA